MNDPMDPIDNLSGVGFVSYWWVSKDSRPRPGLPVLRAIHRQDIPKAQRGLQPRGAPALVDSLCVDFAGGST